MIKEVWKKKKYLLISFMVLLVFLPLVNGAKIDAIKTYDSYIDTLLANQSTTLHEWNQSKINLYGSFDQGNWEGSAVNVNCRVNEAALGMCWRYNQNLTSELGYNDIYYQNATLIDSCKKNIQFLAWAQSENGYFSDTSTTTFHKIKSGLGTVVGTNLLTEILSEIYNLTQADNFLGNYSRIIRKDNLTNSGGRNLQANNEKKRLIVYFHPENIVKAELFIRVNKQDGNSHTLSELGLPTNLNFSVNNRSQNYSFYVGDITSISTWINASFSVSDLVYGENYIYIWRNTGWNATDYINLRRNNDISGDSWEQGLAEGDFGAENFEHQVYLNITIDLNKTIYTIIKNATIYIESEKNNGVGKNTLAHSALTCYKANKILNDATSETCYKDYLNRIVDESQDEEGILAESSNALFGTIIKGGCYDSNYQTIALEALAEINEQLQWSNVSDIINNASELVFYHITKFQENESLLIENAYSCRTDDERYFFKYGGLNNFIGSDIQNILWAFYLNNKWANKIVNETGRIFINYSDASGLLNRVYATYRLIKLYQNWKQENSNLNWSFNTGRYFKRFYTLISIKTKPVFYLSYGNTTPTGGVITDIYYNQTNRHLFSGRGANLNHYGFGVLKNLNNNFSNVWDKSSKYSLLSGSFPYKINIRGFLTNSSGSESQITHNTTYTFYDDYIEVNQTSSSNVELQLWSVSKEQISSGTLNAGTFKKLNNATIFPVNFNLEYNDTDEIATYGTVDKLNASGTNFYYFVGIGDNFVKEEDYIHIKNEDPNKSIILPLNSLSRALVYNPINLTVYGKTSINENNGNINVTLTPNNETYILDYFNLTEGASRENSPLGFNTSSSNIKKITSNLTVTLFNVTVIVNTSGITPDKPKFTSHTGAYTKTYSSNEYTYDATKQTLTLNISGIEPASGSNELTLDSIPPDINITYPLNVTYTTQPVQFNYTANDTNLQACWYSTDNGQTNTTITCGQNISGLNPNVGSNTYLIGANDSSGNENFTYVTFNYEDTIYPQFSNYTDNNGSLTGSGIARFNATINQTNGTVFFEIGGTNYSASNTTPDWFNISVSISSSGTYSYYWMSWGNGAGKNYNTSTISYYTVNQTANSETGSSGGGSGNSNKGTRAQSLIKSWTRITPENPQIMENLDEGLAIRKIRITVNKEIKNVKIIVNEYSQKPAEIPKGKSGKVYKYVKISSKNLLDGLVEGIITTQITKLWLAANNINKDEISIFKFTAGEWKELETTYKGEDRDCYYYNTPVSNFNYNTPVSNFSFFAVGEKTGVEEKGKQKREEAIEEQIKEGKKLKDWILLNKKLIIMCIGVLLILTGVFLVKYRKRIKIYFLRLRDLKIKNRF